MLLLALDNELLKCGDNVPDSEWVPSICCGDGYMTRQISAWMDGVVVVVVVVLVWIDGWMDGQLDG